MVLVGYGFDPEVDPYFWTFKSTDCFKSITDSDLTALNAKICEKMLPLCKNNVKNRGLKTLSSV